MVRMGDPATAKGLGCMKQRLGLEGLTARVRWRLRLWRIALRERVFGIHCAGCGESARLPAPRGWRFGTCAGGDARWLCGDCMLNGAEPPQF